MLDPFLSAVTSYSCSGTLAFPKEFSCWFKYYGQDSGASLIKIARMMSFGKYDVVMLLRRSWLVSWCGISLATIIIFVTIYN